LFDVCSGICDTPPQAEESALVHALAYFEGVLGWRIADINHVSYLQVRVAQYIIHAWIRLCTVAYYVNLY
jgi:hypothetical protein